jgi:DNA polymerase III alpha subunit (gram-positive type)
MDAAYYYRKAQEAQKEIAQLQEQKARCSRTIADAGKTIASARQTLSRTQNASTLTSKQRMIEREEQKIVAEQKRISEIDAKIAKKQQQVAKAQQDAQKEEKRALEKRQREEQKQRREAEQYRRNQERRAHLVDSRLERHEILHESTRMDLEALKRLPEEITVLVLAANPIDQTHLRLDEEVRLIDREIRSSEYRDAIKLKPWLAVRPMDLLQAINEIRPSILHFSGHGDQNGFLYFQDDNGKAKPVSLRAIVETIRTSNDIQLVFLNACFSADQAQALVKYIPVAIGMTDAVDDTSARVFAAKFYSAIGFGYSVKRAFDQARAALLLEDLPDEDVAFLFAEEDLDPNEIIFVRPAGL